MSAIELKLSSRILKEHYGDIVEKVCIRLISYGATPLRPLAQELSLKVDQVSHNWIALNVTIGYGLLLI